MIEDILDQFVNGQIPREELERQYNNWKINCLGHTHLDISRKNRIGVEEFIYGEHKSCKQLMSIVSHYIKIKSNVLITRLSIEKQKRLKKQFPQIHYSLNSGLAWYKPNSPAAKAGINRIITVVTAGTSDAKVALEALISLKYMGYRSNWIKDVGVAGIQRILSKVEELDKATCIIVIAGMEGTLPTVVSGLTGKPVIAVPTSIGYGAADRGFTPLKAMLSSCATSVCVVNIDNGFGAACFADSMLRQFA